MMADVGVEKKSVRLLQFVEIRGEFGGDAVGVFGVVRRADTPGSANCQS